jgi:NADH-quinone oxidoreductase subunit F
MAGRQLFMSFPITETSHSLAEYRARGGYGGLDKALKQMKPAEIVKEVTASGLQGRGGAAFAVGRKWQVIDYDDGQPHFLIANADEGEPGTFKDRWILENDPHRLVESMIITSYALNVRNAFIYIRGEFDLPYRRLAGAVEEAYAAGFLGERILGTDYSCDLVVYRGAGAYVAGEASGLISSLEGKKSYPRNRPPRLTVKGLYQRPTVVNNVESLANISWIVQNGAEAFKSYGTPKSPGTRLFSVSGHVNKPGVYEVELGYSWMKFLDEDCGGMRQGRAIKCVVPGGVSSKVLTGADIKDLVLSHESAWDAGSTLGSGGMIVIAEGTCMVALMQVILRFYHHESCGQCTPCRHGTGWMHRIIDRIVAGKGVPEDIERLYYISKFNDGTTICGLGDAAGYACSGILDKFRDEFEYYIEHKRSRFDGNLECLRSS